MNLDQTIVNWVFGVAGALGSFVLKAMWDAITQLRSDMASLNDKIARDYVRRDDYRDDIAEVKAMLARIVDKLDQKLDKP